MFDFRTSVSRKSVLPVIEGLNGLQFHSVRLEGEDASKIGGGVVAPGADGKVGGIPVADLHTQVARDRAGAALEMAGTLPNAATEGEAKAALAAHRFFHIHAEPDPAVTAAAIAALARIERKVAAMQAAEPGFDASSPAAIHFPVAICLAITFGVTGALNMAHGEFITIRAHTGFVVRLFGPEGTLSLPVALTLALAVTLAVGVAMERPVIRHLCNRPLERRLATLGSSIAVQQVPKSVRDAGAARQAGRGTDLQRCGVDQPYPHRDLRPGTDLPGVLPLPDEAHASGARSPRGDAEPDDGGQHGDQPRPHQHADLRSGVRHRGGRPSGFMPRSRP